jgi:hypothetical protein
MEIDINKKEIQQQIATIVLNFKREKEEEAEKTKAELQSLSRLILLLYLIIFQIK